MFARMTFFLIFVLALAFSVEAQSYFLTNGHKGDSRFGQKQSVGSETRINDVAQIVVSSSGDYLQEATYSVVSLEGRDYRIRQIGEWVNWLVREKKIHQTVNCPRCELRYSIHLLPSKDGKMSVNYQEKITGDEINITVKPEAISVVLLH